MLWLLRNLRTSLGKHVGFLPAHTGRYNAFNLEINSPMFNNWQFWLAVAVSILFLLLLLYQVDLGHIRSALLEANYLYVAPAIGVYFVAVYFRSARWKFLLSPVINCSVTGGFIRSS